MADNRAVLSQMLCDAALENDVNVLRDLLSKDPFLLARSNTNSTSCSPLHIACKEGCLEFVRELLSRRPVLSEDLDSNKSSPLHIASQNGHFQLIQPLVEAKPTMCFSRDMLGMTPFHLAAMNGYLPVLEELLRLTPVAAKERVGGVGGDTILHLCVKYNQLGALKMVIEKVGEAEFLNAKNEDGNTILHLAVANNQYEMDVGAQILEELLKENRLEKNTLNSNGWTATNILMLSNKVGDNNKDKKSDEPRNKKNDEPLDDKVEELREKLEKAGAFPSTDIRRVTETDMYLNLFESKRSALIVAAALVAAVAFQAGVNLPGGVWQDTQLSNSTTTAANSGNQSTHIAGIAILASQAGTNYQNFLIINTICLVSAISSMVLLILSLPPKPVLLFIITLLLYITLIFLTFAYSMAVYAMTYGRRKATTVSALLYLLPMYGTLIMLFSTIRLVTNWPRDREVGLYSIITWVLPFLGSARGRR